MATYRDIAREVKIRAGFVPKTCWMAQVMEMLGLKLRRAPNRIDLGERKYPCPPEKIPAIIAALYKLGKAQPGGRQRLYENCSACH
jgi:hypothetical protein